MAPPCPARRKNLRRRLHDVDIAGKCLAERGHLGGFIGESLTGAERRETGDDDRVLRAVAQQLRLLQVRVQLHLHMPLGLHLGYSSRPSRDALAWSTAGGMAAYDSTSRSAHVERLHAPMLRARPERARPSIACAGVALTYVRRRGTAPPPSFTSELAPGARLPRGLIRHVRSLHRRVVAVGVVHPLGRVAHAEVDVAERDREVDEVPAGFGRRVRAVTSAISTP